MIFDKLFASTIWVSIFNMIGVSEAEKLVSGQIIDCGQEKVSIDEATGRVLAEPILADRDYPAGNRSTMDGIAVKFAQLKRCDTFAVKAMQPAGVKPIKIDAPNQCVQIMTGAILDKSVDTVIKIEDLKLVGGQAIIKSVRSVERGQFVHKKGSDKKRDDIVINAGTTIGAKEIAVLASFGLTKIKVNKLPKVAVITTGDELIGVEEKAKDYQIRRSNDRTISSVLLSYSIKADRLHLPDNKQKTIDVLAKYVDSYDVIIISGGVSKGEFDYVQVALSEVGAKKVFHGIAQRPGKPFWFGKKSKTIIFAFPGNAVSSYLCMHRYFAPWLVRSLGQSNDLYSHAILTKPIKTKSELTRFTPVIVAENKGKLTATPLPNNGSGDFISLINADAFIEIPAHAAPKKDQLLKIWPIL